MQLPIWQPSFLGPGMTIGLDAVVHVMVSHGVAIGAFAMVLLSDWLVLRSGGRDAEAWDRFDHTLLKFIVVTASAVGAATGAGIWFVTGTVAPAAIGSMLRLFFWPWFAEWFVFVVELLILLAYWFSWKRLDRRRRVRAGVAYLFVVGLSGFLISGILGFMLTPGEWPLTRRFDAAFFNPSFPPQLLFRLTFGVVLGALIALSFAAFGRWDEAFRKKALARYGRVVLWALAPFALFLGWYFVAVPPAYLTRLRFSLLTSRLSQSPWIFVLANVLAAAAILVVGLAGRLRLRRTSKVLALPALVLMLGFVVEFERVREFVRGPFLMPGHMWANSVLLEQTPMMRAGGALAESGWYLGARPAHDPDAYGAYLFARSCSGCHTIDGLNDIRAKARGRSEDGLYVLLGRTHEMVSFMPPFAGSDEERRAVARFLYRLWSEDLALDSHARYRPAREGTP